MSIKTVLATHGPAQMLLMGRTHNHNPSVFGASWWATQGRLAPTASDAGLVRGRDTLPVGVPPAPIGHQCQIS